MNFRSLFLHLLTLSLALAARGETTPVSAPVGQPVAPAPVAVEPAKIPKPETPKSAVAPKPRVMTEKYTTTIPLELHQELGVFPAKPVEQVRVFEGMSAFQKFVDEMGVAVCPIGDFNRAIMPEDEGAFREVLRAHAAQCGADYLTVVTDGQEIVGQMQVLPMEKYVYCAVAYKRIEARLGIESDKEEAQKFWRTKVTGFLLGSKARDGGVCVGDIIKKVDGVSTAMRAYWAKALHWKVGEKVKVEVERDGKLLEFEVVLTAG